MNQRNNSSYRSSVSENVLSGAAGALLFALGGGVLWFVIYQVGYISAAVGLVTVLLAIRGYSKFARQTSIKGVIIASVISLLVLVLAWYLYIGKDIFVGYQNLYDTGEVEYAPTFMECIKIIPSFMEDPGFADGYIDDLIKTLAFTILGAGGTVVSVIKSLKN